MVKCCPHCSKKFKMKKSLAKHMMLCQLDNKDKNELTVIPTQKEMWLILQKLYADNEKLKKKVESLENIVNKDVKKMNMIDWLNENDKGINIEGWLKTNIRVTLEDLKMIFIINQ